MEESIKIYIDHNYPYQLAEAFNIIQSHLNIEEKKSIEVLSIMKEFGQKVDDDKWIPKIGNKNGIIITLDRRIQRSRMERQLYIDNNIGVIFFHSSKPGLSFWEMFKHMVRWWDDIKSIVRTNKPPFAFRQPGSNEKFVLWD